jgi:hypothetical protein
MPELAVLNRVYALLCELHGEPRRRTANRRQAAPVVMPEMVDVRDVMGVALLWAFIEAVEDDTALPKPKKRKAGETVDVPPVKALPMQPTPLPAPAPRVSPLERTRREGLGYDEVYAGTRVKKLNGKDATVKGDPVINRALSELVAVVQRLAATG